MEQKLDLSQLSTAELKAVLARRQEDEKKARREKRDAYEGLRDELLIRMQRAVLKVTEENKGFLQLCDDESGAFRKILEDYGQLKKKDQLSFTIRNDQFKWEIKCNKIKRFDERADAAASKLVEFLRSWIQNKEDGTDNPMYQLAMTLLERNKNGDLDYKSISKLYDMEDKFDDPEYSAIMQLFRESNIVDSTSVNHYFSQRDDMGVWRRIELSFNRL